ncbi:YecA family protein [Vibrio sp. SM6]|uniref:UPF0149 protein HGP28_08075 n=1 Tax=Vibrio agarilyticus TaxID=2726741 RepID=A0A7X8TQK6_9VIBR|nr:YecA family protein [Vibrio agarilyticus]NLS12856.1 YecA family protein [Vibrio agarilyticus]
MSENRLPNYSLLETELKNAALAVTPSELQGLLIGMLSGGLNLHDLSWQPLLFDYTNDGMGWPASALAQAQRVLSAATAELTSGDMTLSLLLPSDDSIEGLFALADNLAEWVNHFISGLGLIGADLTSMSQESREALNDLEEIAKLGIDEDDSLEEQSELLEQVIEHVKACVLIIHAEFGAKPEPTQAPTVH